ncbi:IS1182 family transposase [Christensenella sp. NSJ-35]|jgi:transposase|uniref:IS1182 family transposase n=2 Tax=Christensenella tenuis TaxID=2763033 RepID=A0ABR7EE00_9FIRM|nr:IS1182 family transposase [Christensenella tenuis]
MLIPEDHLLRQIEKTVDFSFIYPLAEGIYSPDKGRPGVDPVVLVKIVLIQYLYGICSMRQTIEEIRYNVAYRWFLGYDLYKRPPHFSTFGKNYKRRFEGTDLFEQIFTHMVELCIHKGAVRAETLFVDATHLKASANKHKKVKREIQKQVKSYHEELLAEINRDREAHGKEPFDDDPPPGSAPVTQSTTDPDSGMFVKGEHKRDFAYSIQTACDRHGCALAYDVAAGNVHDSVSFEGLYRKLLPYNPLRLVTDVDYKTPAIMRMLLTGGIMPVVPYTSPKAGKGFLKKSEYIYDEYYDCYICPENKILSYSTTNREGYREYKSKKYVCGKGCRLSECTRSKTHTKVIMRHIWEEYMEQSHHIRYMEGIKELYAKRKETIERVFGDAKEKHGFRYTQYRCKAKIEMEVALAYTAMNLKKLARWLTYSFGFLSLSTLFL